MNTVNYQNEVVLPLNTFTSSSSYVAGQGVYLVGESAYSLYRLKSGLLRFYKVTPEGKSITVRHILPGDYFGEETFDSGYRQDNAESLTDSEIEIFSPDYFSELQKIDLVKSMTEQIQRVMNFQYHLQQGGLLKRVVRYLLVLANTDLAIKQNNVTVLPITHSLIAEGCAGTRESVSAFVSSLVKQAYIASGYAKITLIDPEGLECLLDEAIVF